MGVRKKIKMYMQKLEGRKKKNKNKQIFRV